MYSVKFENNNIYVTLSDFFDLAQTLDCGQAFRWEPVTDTKWQGIAFGKYLQIEKISSNQFVLYNTSFEEFNSIWKEYFDFDRNYTKIIKAINKNEVLKTASEYGKGIRVLNQDPWETLCSFIISQNNNIKRIKGIISRLCESFGDEIEGGFTFPAPEKLANLSVEDLSDLRAGFRAKYIIDAAQKVYGKEINLENLKDMPLDEAQAELMKIKGVGPKVADCALLFSHKHIAAFPKDVWIKRAMQVLFNGE